MGAIRISRRSGRLPWFSLSPSPSMELRILETNSYNPRVTRTRMLTGQHNWSSQRQRQSTVKLTQGTSSFSPPENQTRVHTERLLSFIPRRSPCTSSVSRATSTCSPPGSLTRRLLGPDRLCSLSQRLGTTWASNATSTSPPLADPSTRPTCPTETPALVLLVRSRLPSRRSGLVIGPSISQRVSSRSLLSLREYCHYETDLKRAR